LRNATEVSGVDVKQRIIEVIAVPYDQEAPVAYRGDMWLESFDRGAFDGIQTRSSPIMVNREHVRGDTVGKVLQWWPERSEGLVAEVKVARTMRGDETLALAEEGMIRASIGFGVRLRDQVLDRSAMKRRILKAFVDHLGLVEAPAYAGAEVLGVRGSEFDNLAADMPPIVARPVVDELAAWLASRRS
jgi:phage head maturation protease